MKVDPVARYTEPRFPTHTILDAHPELLRVVPARWRNNQVVLTVLASLCLAVTSCKAATSADTHAKSAQIPALSLVAPIFEHGAGHGAFGCQAVNPPVFLSEEEARQVIIEEGKRAGISFNSDSITLPDIKVPITNEFNTLKGAKTKVQTLKLDGTDLKRHISYEYLSQSDYHAWNQQSNFRSSVSFFDIIGAANILRDGIAQKQPKGAYAVFYDPLIGYKAGELPATPIKQFNDSTLAPIQLFNFWGYEAREINGSVILKHENRRLKITPGSDLAILNNKKIILPCKVLKINGAVYAPLRAVARLLKLQVRWDQKQSTVSLRMTGDTSELHSNIVSKQNIAIAFSESDSIGQTATAKDLARTELRQQVRDFITWLKGQGVI